MQWAVCPAQNPSIRLFAASIPDIRLLDSLLPCSVPVWATRSRTTVCTLSSVFVRGFVCPGVDICSIFVGIHTLGRDSDQTRKRGSNLHLESARFVLPQYRTVAWGTVQPCVINTSQVSCVFAGAIYADIMFMLQLCITQHK